MHRNEGSLIHCRTRGKKNTFCCFTFFKKFLKKFKLPKGKIARVRKFTVPQTSMNKKKNKNLSILNHEIGKAQTYYFTVCILHFEFFFTITRKR